MVRNFVASCLTILIGTCSISLTAHAESLPTIHFIGVSFSGLYNSIPERFPYTVAIVGFGTHRNTVDHLTKVIDASFKKSKPQHFILSTQPISDLKGSYQAIDLTMLMSKEIVLQVHYEVDGKSIYKVFAEVRAQALYFDIKRSAMVSDIPLSSAYDDVFNHSPSHDEIMSCVQLAIYGSDRRSGLVGKFLDNVRSSSFPSSKVRYLNVKAVDVSPKVMTSLGIEANDNGKSLNNLTNNVADTFAETLSAGQGISFIPYAKDYLVGGRIPLSVTDGDTYSLALPQADYLFRLRFSGVKEVTFGQNASGESLIYGVWFHIELDEPLSGHKYLDSNFKNGVVVVVPATEVSSHQSDKFAYNDAMRELFEHLSHAISVGSTDWISKAASASDISSQLRNTRKLFQSCK